MITRRRKRKASPSIGPPFSAFALKQRQGARGFTLVELMVTVAILAILSAVAIPAYVNYVNRIKQGEAAHYLLTARMEQEEYFADNGKYAATIGCLPSFGGDCKASTARLNYYTFRVGTVSSQYFRVTATRKIYNGAGTDELWISSSTEHPVVVNESAIKFSLFKLLFN